MDRTCVVEAMKIVEMCEIYVGVAKLHLRFEYRLHKSIACHGRDIMEAYQPAPLSRANVRYQVHDVLQVVGMSRARFELATSGS